MAALADRVKESTATTGQGTVTLAGAAVGFRSFTAAFGNGVSVYYVIAGGAEWEVGIGTTGAGTLSRDTVIGSSAGGTTKVTFSAGTKDVFCSVPASRLVLTDNLASANTANAVVQRDGSGNFAAGTITAALTGNASTATALQTARTINGVSFNGTADITVTAAAGTLSGNTLASGVTASSLTSVGTLTSLTVSGNIGLGGAPSAWSGLGSAFQFNRGSLVMGSASSVDAYFSSNAFWDGSGWKYIGTAAATQYTQNVSGDHRWWVAASGTAGNAISFTQAMTLNASGGLQTLNTIGVGNTTPATSGAGISFPATQSASSDANTLDDYEEGTWVPTLLNLTLGNAVTVFRYVKVGQMVTLDIVIEWGSTTSSSGQWRISLPFNAQATGGGSAYLYDDTGSEYVVPATVYTASFGQNLVIGSGSGAGFVTNTAPFTWAQNDRFGCSITYRATA